jgi:hypothetical protein
VLCHATFFMLNSKFGPGARCYLIAALILVAGMVAAVVIYLNATDSGGDALAYEFADGTVYAVDPADCKMRSGPEKSGAWISDISASMSDGSRRPTGAESNEKTAPKSHSRVQGQSGDSRPQRR